MASVASRTIPTGPRPIITKKRYNKFTELFYREVSVQRFFCLPTKAHSLPQHQLFKCGAKECENTFRFRDGKLMWYCNAQMSQSRQEEIEMKYVVFCSWACFLVPLDTAFMSVA